MNLSPVSGLSTSCEVTVDARLHSFRLTFGWTFVMICLVNSPVSSNTTPRYSYSWTTLTSALLLPALSAMPRCVRRIGPGYEGRSGSGRTSMHAVLSCPNVHICSAMMFPATSSIACASTMSLGEPLRSSQYPSIPQYMLSPATVFML
jgi:hypothetical protein